MVGKTQKRNELKENIFLALSVAAMLLVPFIKWTIPEMVGYMAVLGVLGVLYYRN